MNFPFNSRDARYKSPFGAVATHQKIEVNFPVDRQINCLGVRLIVRPYFPDETTVIELFYSGCDRSFNYYRRAFDARKAGVYFYRFEIDTTDGIMFIGAGESGEAARGDWLPEWQQTVFDPAYFTPEWLKGGVIYHIFPDRFARQGEMVKPRFGIPKEWDEELEVGGKDGVYRADDFYGGNFKGVISKLGYLASLGVTAIYFSPIFESNSNHRYDTADYMKIEEMLGSEEDFRELLAKAEERGISVILDGVFNHTGSDSVYFNKFGHYPFLGAYQSKRSPYYEWYTFQKYPDVYTAWWGVDCVPTVSANAQSFQEFITGAGGVIDKWTSAGVRGWRLDVVDELSSAFVEKIRASCKKHGDIAVIGEVWEDASTKISYGEKRKYFLGKELDGVMNYPFRTAILNYARSGNAAAFVSEVMPIIENYPPMSLACSMTLVGSHDTVRIINELSGASVPQTKAARRDYRLTEAEYARAKKKLFAVSLIQFFLPGVPTIYYGDECGVEGFDDPTNRRPFPKDGGDKELSAHYARLGALRAEYRECFKGGAEIFVRGNDLCIKRGRLTAVVNLSEGKQKVLLDGDSILL